jgi:serine/threonine protein kinase
MEPHLCPKCAKPLANDAPHGLCPECLMKAAIKGESQTGRWEAPGTETISPSVGMRIRYFGDYELLDEIARGGMGIVWKARQSSLKRIVALKTIRAGALAGPEEVQRFLREAEAAANLQHPNIVAIHEVGEFQGQHYFSMDYVDGQDLGVHIRNGPLPPRQAARYVRIVVEAMPEHRGGSVVAFTVAWRPAAIN